MSRRAAYLVLLTVGVAACGDDEGPPMTELAVEFRAHADEAPLEGTRVLRDGQLIGTTDADGMLAVSLTGREGETASLSAQCPQGHRNPDDLPELLLRPITDVEGRAQRAMRIDIACRPELRDGVVVVRSNGHADLPVLLDGREVARTDENGVAHVAVRMAPHASFSVQLATAHMPDLRPQAPSLTFTVPDSHEIFVFDQELEREEPQVRRRPRRRAKRGPRPVRIPVRLGSTRR